MSNRCDKTGKIRLYGEAFIKKTLRDMERRNGHAMRSYNCPHCGDTHITSDGESSKAGYNYTPARYQRRI